VEYSRVRGSRVPAEDPRSESRVLCFNAMASPSNAAFSECGYSDTNMSSASLAASQAFSQPFTPNPPMAHTRQVFSRQGSRMIRAPVIDTEVTMTYRTSKPPQGAGTIYSNDFLWPRAAPGYHAVYEERRSLCLEYPGRPWSALDARRQGDMPWTGSPRSTFRGVSPLQETYDWRVTKDRLFNHSPNQSRIATSPQWAGKP